MARPKNQNVWGLSRKVEEPDFARMFVRYVQGKMDPGTEKKFGPFLKEDFFKKVVRMQSSNTEGSSELGRALKVARLYLRSNRRG
ncbi:MAG: hypothetical protein GF334_04000 [Candidatus Altiarchaeales archaeon]|nr:hypothetical protein [Candidatus Altiarchaeales archaeon]